VRAYLTPETAPDDVVLVEIAVPNRAQYFAVLYAVFFDLTWPQSWEQTTGISPFEAAAWAAEILESWELNT